MYLLQLMGNLYIKIGLYKGLRMNAFYTVLIENTTSTFHIRIGHLLGLIAHSFIVLLFNIQMSGICMYMCTSVSRNMTTESWFNQR